MKLSIVVSVYNEEQVIQLFYDEIMKIAGSQLPDYELIFVNDGSSDASQQFIDSILPQNPKVKSILFSRNFGHEAAMIAGLDYSTGDAVVCMDADLQHPPQYLPKMFETYCNEGVDIINMVRSNQKSSLKSSLFYWFINKVSPCTIEPNASDFFLVSKRVAEILRREFRQRGRFLRGFIQVMGFRKTTIAFHAPDRAAGESKYSLRKLFSLSFVAIATLSKLPLRLGIYLGLISAFFSIVLAIYSLVMNFIDKPTPGYTTIVVFLGLMISIQFFILGVIGEYVGYLFDEQKKWPLYLIDQEKNFEHSENQKA
ncbi:glycosyltransferase family 2 protein [Parabacteroides sp. FAFU027]|uniref:glycosyltransferase family 2 protein n=1 Tax=Parabacteroides sp. FAFU027 TaxID=2922715 RepID=UPI001FAF827A|nr:glycosyltransferase family 2 protein [Parabacteroides sp. FAFU027]